MPHRPLVRSSRSVAAAALTSVAAALSLVTATQTSATAGPPALAAPAATQIVYTCGANLCTVDPVTGVSRALTSDGAGYTRPSISLDGSRIAAIRGSSVVAGAYGSGLPEVWDANVEGVNDVAISPDGSTVAASYWYTRLEWRYEYVCGGMCLKLIHYNGVRRWPSAGAPPASHKGSSGVGFLTTSLLSRGFHAGTWNPATQRIEGSLEQVCVVADPADDAATCDPRVNEPDTDAATGREVHLSDMTGSPDGRLIASVVGVVPEADGAITDNPTGESPVIRVYDAATGALVAQVPGNGLSPSFSPDSSQLTYQGTDGSIYVVGARGGEPRKLVAGSYPSWGGGSATAPSPTPGPQPGASRVGQVKSGKSPVDVRKRTVKLRIACPASSDGCQGTARIRVGKKPITKPRSYSVPAGKSSVVKLKVTKKGLRKIKGKPTEATAELTAPGAKKPAVTKKIRLRRR